MKTENIVTEVLPTEFADLCDVTRSAISKGRRAGRIHVNAHGMIPLDHPDNKLYKEGALFRKVGEMSIERRVFPGWSAICVPLPGRLVPVFYYPPVWEAGTVLSDVGGFFDDWKFDMDDSIGWVGIDPQGKKYKCVFLYDQENPPQWFIEDQTREEKASRSCARRLQLRRHPARSSTARHAQGFRGPGTEGAP